MMTIESVRKELRKLSGKTAVFTRMIVPGSQNVLGIRLPELRKLAKEIVRDDPRGFLKANPQEYYEERLLQCFVLGGMKDDFSYLLDRFLEQIPYVDNWAVNDALCMDFKICRKHREETWKAIEPLFLSHNEFEVRVAAVTLLCHFVTEDYVGRVLSVLDRMDTSAYYAMMGVAWAVSEVVVKFPKTGIDYLRTCQLDPKTKRKAIQKSLESYRISAEGKETLREIRSQSGSGRGTREESTEENEA